MSGSSKARIMNINTYASYYAKFHRCPVSALQNNMIVFDLEDSPYTTWTVSRMNPPDYIAVESQKPFILALKTYFKSDVTASVICNKNQLWTICLGKERMIAPLSRDVKLEKKTLHLYATTYFVRSANVVKDYLQGSIRPADENVYFYKNTVLYLDNQDLPYPGGFYYEKNEPTSFYRICFLTDEPMDYVSKLAAEWQSRRGVETIPCMTRRVTAHPKFIDFKPIGEMSFSESNILSNGIIQRVLSSKKPELLIQDILLSYFKHIPRDEMVLDHLGLILEWPLVLSYEGSWTPQIPNENPQFVALSINGNSPKRVIYVMCPYDRYVEYNYVPPTLWTPISFVHSVLLTDTHIQKVSIDTVVIGLVYKETFFCLSQPLLEGRPTRKPTVNSEYLLSVASSECFHGDSNIQILETFSVNDRYSLRRVSLKGIPYNTWCLIRYENTHPSYSRNLHLPHLVKQWLDFFMQVEKQNVFDIDVNIVRLALTLSKHNICYQLNSVDRPKDSIYLSDARVQFNLHEEVVQFINDVRLTATAEEEEDAPSCRIS